MILYPVPAAASLDLMLGPHASRNRSAYDGLSAKSGHHWYTDRQTSYTNALPALPSVSRAHNIPLPRKAQKASAGSAQWVT